MWYKLFCRIWRRRRGERVSVDDAAELPADLAALGQQLTRQACVLAATYPPGAAPRWVAAPASDADALPQPPGPAGAWVRSSLAVHNAHRRARRAAGVLVAGLLAAGLMAAWALIHGPGPARKQPPVSPGFAENKAQPAALRAGAPQTGTRSAEPLLTTRGAAAVTDAIDPREPSNPSTPRCDLTVNLFESLSRPEQEAVLDLLGHVNPAEGTLDL